MMPITPQLVACRENGAVVAGGVVVGCDPGAWLRELEVLGVLPEPDLELYLLPTGAEDRTPAGLLFLAPGAQFHAGTWRSHLYRLLADRLAIPLETALSVPLTNAETQRLFPMHRHILHPGLGHVAFEPEDRVLLSELVETPCPLLVDWHRAHPGLPPSPPLSSVGLRLPADTAEGLLEEGRGEVGTRAEELLEDSEGPAGKAMRQAKRAGLLGLSALGGFVRKIGGEAAGRSGIQSWTQRALERLEESRNRELDRLLRLLNDNPEEGLKYALPLDSHVFARGEASPSGRLEARSTRFDLSALGGGRAVDPWHVQGRMLDSLRQSYRQAADDAQEKGDYDRAAYIHAQLLGDYRTAAVVLKQGRRYQEAARIYQELLHSPAQAAACLEEGGMLLAAAELYAELGRHEEAGDLYERSGSVAEARRQFRLAVEQQVARGGHLHAATLLESRLGELEEAERLLLQAWPSGADAVVCMARYLARREAAEDAEACLLKLRQLGAEPTNASESLKVLRVFAEVRSARSIHAPDAIDHGIPLVGRALQFVGAKAGERRQLLNAMRRLVPDDPLLQRDVGRYMQTQIPPPRPLRRQSPVSVKELASPRRTIRLPAAIRWSRMVAGDTSLLVLGGDERRVVLREVAFEGGWREVAWSGVGQDAPHLLWPRHSRQWAFVFSAMEERFPQLSFERSADFPEPLVAGTPSFALDGVVLAVCEARQYVELVHGREDELLLSRFEQDGAELHDRQTFVPVPGRFADSGTADLGLWNWQGTTHLVVGDLHLAVAEGGAVEQEELPEPALCAAVSASFSTYRVAVADSQGIHLYWPGRNLLLGEPTRLTYDFVPSCMHFLANGMLVASDDADVRVFRTKSGKAEPVLSIPGEAAPVALAGGARIGDLAVLRADGTIGIYSLDGKP